MKTKASRIVWALLPLAALAWYFGPGRVQRLRDEAGRFLREAKAASVEERWERAALVFGQALAVLPDGSGSLRDQIALERARAHLKCGDLVTAQGELEEILGRLASGPERDSRLARAVHHELASASYHAAWLMRLEGAARDEWKPECERARQEFRLLAERAEEEAAPEAALFQRNLEAAIRLEQMDLSELLARPLPKDCPSCKGLSQRKRKQCQSRSDGKGAGKKEDIRKATLG